MQLSVAIFCDYTFEIPIRFFSDLQVLNMQIALVTCPAFDTDSSQFVIYPANKGPCVVLLLVQRRKRWANIETTHGQCPMLVVSTRACGINRDISAVSNFSLKL